MNELPLAKNRVGVRDIKAILADPSASFCPHFGHYGCTGLPLRFEKDPRPRRVELGAAEPHIEWFSGPPPASKPTSALPY